VTNACGEPKLSAGEFIAGLEPCDYPEIINNLALEGDTTALRLYLEHLVSPITNKHEPETVSALDNSKALVEQGQSIINALAKAEVPTSEAATLMQTVTNQARIIEGDALERKHQSRDVIIVIAKETGESDGKGMDCRCCCYFSQNSFFDSRPLYGR
jgi:hypothetical protein